MADHSKHEHGCGCGGKTNAGQQVETDFTLNPARAKANEAACCGASQAKQPKAKAAVDSSARGCCGGHGHD